MLNFEQLLIKTAQYLDLDLHKLQIKQTEQKRRIFTRENAKEKYDEVINELLTEIDNTQLNHELKKILNEFLDYYSYVEKELYLTYSPTYEKQHDWLILKYFVIPFFAVRISDLFTLYYDRIDHGLPGGIFWYLPLINDNKLSYPINFIMKWWIDLYGTSNEDFYYDRNATEDDVNELDGLKNEIEALEQRHNLLKSWRYKPAIPEMSSIIKYTASKLNYKGVFTSTKTTIEAQFLDALSFVHNKKCLNLEDLKKEIPNPNNLLDRLSKDLDSMEKEKFVRFVEQRWAEPTKEQLKSLLTIARISQMVFKEIGEYFGSDYENIDVTRNCSFQLSILYSDLYNFNTSLKVHQADERYAIYKNYFDFFYDSPNTKDVLDKVIAKISHEIVLEQSRFCIDEVIINHSTNKVSRKKSMQRLREAETKQNKLKTSNQEIQVYIRLLSSISNLKEIKDILKDANERELHNLGDYYVGHNYLTNDEPTVKHDVAFEILKLLYITADSDLYRTIGIFGILNLTTFPFYQRLLKKEDVEQWFLKLEETNYKEDKRAKLIALSYRAYHEIIQKNYLKAIPIIVDVMNKTKKIKQEEYNYELMCIGEIVSKLVKNRTLENKLKKRNKYHKTCEEKKYIYSLSKGFFYY